MIPFPFGEGVIVFVAEESTSAALVCEKIRDIDSMFIAGSGISEGNYACVAGGECIKNGLRWCRCVLIQKDAAAGSPGVMAMAFGIAYASPSRFRELLKTQRSRVILKDAVFLCGNRDKVFGDGSVRLRHVPEFTSEQDLHEFTQGLILDFVAAKASAFSSTRR